MKKFDDSLIEKFIKGETIDDYSQEELSNSVDFMISVFEYKNNTAWYSLCSDSVKCDYDFNKYLINTFLKEQQFLEHVIRYIYKNMKDHILLSDLLIYYKSKTNNNLILDETDLDVIIDYIYREYRQTVKRFQKNNNSNKTSLGFNGLLNRGVIEKEILDFYAKNMFNEIACMNPKNYIRIFENKEIPDPNLIVTLCVSKYDTALAQYIKENSEIALSWYNKEKESNTYSENIEQEGYLAMIREAKEYYLRQKRNLPFKGLLYYIAREFNIIEKLYLYDNLKPEQSNLFLDENYFIKIRKSILQNPGDEYLYNQMVKIVINHLSRMDEEKNKTKFTKK